MRKLKMWDFLNTTQKRHRIFSVTKNDVISFWVVCGKDRQKYYNSIPITDDNADKVRDEMYNEYMECINRSGIFDRKNKIDTISVLLGKGEIYEKILHDMEVKRKK